MNFYALLLEFLKINGAAPISGFGTFYLNYVNASLDQDGKSLLPPGTEVAFKKNTAEQDEQFIQFIKDHEDVSYIEAQIEVRKHVNSWNAALAADKILTLENVGEFTFINNELHFSGLRTENNAPNFYGLEEIQLTEIKDAPSPSSSYKFSKSIWWIVAALIIMAGITFVGITQPEIIFGKKSFPKVPAKKTGSALPKDLLPSDTARSSRLADSIQVDSLKLNTALPTVVDKK